MSTPPDLHSTATLTGDGLIDALDRLLESGAAIAGDVVIGVAGIPLIRLDLRALLTGVVSAVDEAGVPA